jgi:hypothetical protein
MLRPGDLVLSRSETDPHGQNVLRRIEEVFVRRVQSLQILTIRSSCGTLQTLYTTQVHPIYINARGWIDAAHIEVGDQILEPTGSLSTVTASRFENHPDGILVYNFRVAGTHTYFVREAGRHAEPIWVHNATCEVEEFSDYLDEVESVTGRAVGDPQRSRLEWEVENGSFEYQGAEIAESRRKAFDGVKKKLIAQWEEHTGQSWPRYEETVFDAEDEVARKIGDPYDAHEFIPNSYAGPQEWWNIHPAKFPTEHQAGIHGAGRLFREIFPAR